jgi:hypothetical protein
VSTIGRRVRRWFRQFRRREAAYAPITRSGLMYDPAFVAGSFRPGERVDPLSTSLEE